MNEINEIALEQISTQLFMLELVSFAFIGALLISINHKLYILIEFLESKKDDRHRSGK